MFDTQYRMRSIGIPARVTKCVADMGGGVGFGRGGGALRSFSLNGIHYQTPERYSALVFERRLKRSRLLNLCYYRLERNPHMANAELLGVRVKVWQNGKVAVLFYQRLGNKIVKRYLDDDGIWQDVKEGEVYPGISLVFHELGNPFDNDMI